MPEDHDRDGKFETGNKAAVGPNILRGASKSRSFAEFLRILGDEPSLEDGKYTRWQKIALKAFELAERGNRDARNWLTDRAFGKATDGVSADPKAFAEKLLLKYGTSPAELNTDPVARELLRLLGIAASSGAVIGEADSIPEIESGDGDGEVSKSE